MADPARYHIDIKHGEHGYDLLVERGNGATGQWVKWLDFVDYKSAQRRNKNEATVVKLGLEIVHLKTRIEDLEEEIKALKDKASK